MDALQSVLASALGLLPAPLQSAAATAGGLAFDAAMEAVEAGLVPDAVIRRGIRALLSQRDGEVRAGIAEVAREGEPGGATARTDGAPPPPRSRSLTCPLIIARASLSLSPSLPSSAGEGG